MRISIVGTGYVGLVVGTGLAESGHTITCVDKDAERIEALRQGNLPLYEPGLEELVVRNQEEERLRFTTDLAKAIEDCLLVFICVNTPSAPDGTADVSQVYEVARDVGQLMKGYRIVVNKSTCPVGTTDRIREILSEATQCDFDVVMNPEFLKEGNAVDDFLRPDRIVIGCDEVRVVEIMKELYAPFLRTGRPFITMDVRSAEMTKYAVNTMLASRISLMNQLAGIAEAYGADIGKIREGLASDERIGSSYLFPGLGYGGSCLPKDVLACAHLARSKSLDSDLLDAISATNTRQRDRFIAHILEYYGAGINKKNLAVWGASFKPRTDDIRNAPAIAVIDALLEAGASVSVYDPAASKRLESNYAERIRICTKNYAALEKADGLIICTEWNEFRRPDYERMASLMNEKVIFDGRNLYTPSVLQQAGFRYFSIGRPAV